MSPDRNNKFYHNTHVPDGVVFSNGYVVAIHEMDSPTPNVLMGPFKQFEDANLLLTLLAQEGARDYHLWPVFGISELKEEPLNGK